VCLVSWRIALLGLAAGRCRAAHGVIDRNSAKTANEFSGTARTRGAVRPAKDPVWDTRNAEDCARS
jgi:hypothetical protein